MSSNKYGDKYIEIEEQAKKAIKKFDETCEKIARCEPKQHQEWKYVNEFGFANTFTGRWE